MAGADRHERKKGQGTTQRIALALSMGRLCCPREQQRSAQTHTWYTAATSWVRACPNNKSCGCVAPSTHATRFPCTRYRVPASLSDIHQHSMPAAKRDSRQVLPRRKGVEALSPQGISSVERLDAMVSQAGGNLKRKSHEYRTKQSATQKLVDEEVNCKRCIFRWGHAGRDASIDMHVCAREGSNGGICDGIQNRRKREN